MKKQYSHPIILGLAIAFASMYSTVSCRAGDLLDSVKSNTKLVIELKDVYRAFEIYHSITEQGEYIAISIDTDYTAATADNHEPAAILDSLTNIDVQLKKMPFHDDSLHIYSTRLLDATIESYRDIKKKGMTSADFKSAMGKYGEALETYMTYLENAYSTSHFEKIDEDTYWKTVDKKNYMKSPAFTRYQKLDSTAFDQKVYLLDSIADHTKDFQEYALYRIELADLYVKYGDHQQAKSDTTLYARKAVDIYKSVLERHTYCLYLFEAWLKWRVVYQQNNGLSKYSDIPNDRYDKVREQEAAFILKRVAEKTDDEMCINEFLLFATHGIVQRFGEYPYGNQNTVEYHEIFGL